MAQPFCAALAVMRAQFAFMPNSIEPASRSVRAPTPTAATIVMKMWRRDPHDPDIDWSGPIESLKLSMQCATPRAMSFRQQQLQTSSDGKTELHLPVINPATEKVFGSLAGAFGVGLVEATKPRFGRANPPGLIDSG
ncbi:MAG: hypothetical protein E5W88_32745, partial [Mesorhizobium sp.]